MKKIEKLRGMTKRSTYIEHLIKLGLTIYKTNEKTTAKEPRA